MRFLTLTLLLLISTFTPAKAAVRELCADEIGECFYQSGRAIYISPSAQEKFGDEPRKEFAAIGFKVIVSLDGHRNSLKAQAVESKRAKLDDAFAAVNDDNFDLTISQLRCGLMAVTCVGGLMNSIANPLMLFFARVACVDMVLGCAQVSTAYNRWERSQKAYERELKEFEIEMGGTGGVAPGPADGFETGDGGSIMGSHDFEGAIHINPNPHIPEGFVTAIDCPDTGCPQ